MPQSTVNERLKILVERLGMSVRAFSTSIGVADTTTRNYLDRGTNPKSDYLAKILRQFKDINPNWLFTGEGDMFLPGKESTHSTNVTTHKNKGNIQTNTGHATVTNNVKLEECKAELATVSSELATVRAQLEGALNLVASKDATIAAQAETILLLRATYTRPN